MASGFFAILDDIAALMDDVAINAKLATKKTAGILGDDLAVNAEKSTGFVSSREMPVLWAITKGSFINKLIIVPVTLLLNIFLPAAIILILIIGGFYLAFEGVEKIAEYFFHKKQPAQQAAVGVIKEDAELEKIKNKLLAYDIETRGFRKMSTNEYSSFKLFYNELLAMKSAEEKHKAHTYDLVKEVVSPNGKVVTIVEKFSGDNGDL
jgi:predicted DNA repair protein MutK